MKHSIQAITALLVLNSVISYGNVRLTNIKSDDTHLEGEVEIYHDGNYYFLYNGLGCHGNEINLKKCSNWNKNVMDLKVCSYGIAIAA
uniref:SRCR domain-containing protein n=1 Tax=Strigamia maritima TaxID=126957 RepID=T1IWU7_STRMM